MDEIEKSVLGSVRLDSDVWDAVRAMPESLNVFLRRELLEGAFATPERLARIAANVRPRRRSKRDVHVAALRASDPLATIVGRDDIEHGNMELPSSGSIATSLDAVGPKVSEGRGKATTQHFVRGIRPKGDKTR